MQLIIAYKVSYPKGTLIVAIYHTWYKNLRITLLSFKDFKYSVQGELGAKYIIEFNNS